MKKILKNQRGITLVKLGIIIIIAIIAIAFIGRTIKIASIENTKLTKENFQSTMDDYSKLKKDTDDIVYAGYAIMYYTMTDYMSNIFNSNATEDDAYAQVYGKSLSKLKDEGKSLMKKNNITPKEFKEKLSSNTSALNSNSSNSSDTSNQQVYGLNQEVTLADNNGGTGTITITGIREMSERNQFSDAPYTQIFLIDYTYKNNSISDYMYVSDMNFKIVDEQGEVGGTYPNSKSLYPEEIVPGTTCRAQMIFGVNNRSNKVKLQYWPQSGGSKPSVIFELNV